MKTLNRKELIERMAEARSAALNSTKHGYLRARSPYLIGTTNAVGGPTSVESEPWDGTMRHIDALIAVISDHPDVAKVHIAGGYDGAKSLSDYFDGNYEPWAASWDVVIWDREATVEPIVRDDVTVT